MAKNLQRLCRCRSSWFGRYSYADEVATAPALYLNGTKLLTNVKQAMLSNTRVFSPAMVNEFRAGYNYFFNSLGRELATERDVVSELKIPGVSLGPPIAWGIPSISIAGFDGFGDDSEGPIRLRHLIRPEPACSATSSPSVTSLALHGGRLRNVA